MRPKKGRGKNGNNDTTKRVRGRVESAGGRSGDKRREDDQRNFERLWNSSFANHEVEEASAGGDAAHFFHPTFRGSENVGRRKSDSLPRNRPAESGTGLAQKKIWIMILKPSGN